MITATQPKANYKPIRKMPTGQYVIMFKIADVDEDNVLVCQGLFDSVPSEEEMKTLVASHVNDYIDEKILSGMKWNGYDIWLSTENQANYTAACMAGTFPYRCKFQQNGNDVYHTFNTKEDMIPFYTTMVSYIQSCLEQAWSLKELEGYSLQLD